MLKVLEVPSELACVPTSLIFWHSCDINLISVVFRAGYKLEAAIEHFKCDVAEKVALDAGLSTGGFTDCLLQSGAACVYGVDVGYGQVCSYSIPVFHCCFLLVNF